MMFRHRGYRTFLILVLSLLLIVGCTSAVEETKEAATNETEGAQVSEVDEAGTEAPAEVIAVATEEKMEPVTITYIASQNWVLDTEMELAKQFEAETGIHVDFQIIPSDQYFNVLQTKLEAGGEGLDIFGGQSGKTDIALQLNVEDGDLKPRHIYC